MVAFTSLIAVLPFIFVLYEVVTRVIWPAIAWLTQAINNVAASARFAALLPIYVPDVVGQIFMAMVVFSVLCCIFGRIK